MSIFNQLKQQLNEQINLGAGIAYPEYGFIGYQVEIPLQMEKKAFLSYLKAQEANLNSYPHFYWQNREATHQIVSMGVIQQFEQLEAAEQFVQASQQPLIGGMPFEGEPCFILPRLLLIQQNDSLRFIFNIKQEELAEQAVILAQFFANFTAALPLQRSLAKNPLISQHSAYDFAHWEKSIALAIQAIEQGLLSKVVLANKKTLQFAEPISAYDLLAESQQCNTGSYHFLFAHTPNQYFLGSSPERLYKRVNRQLFTEALAGTVAVSEDLEQTEQNAQWLLNDPKNCYENQLVVEDIHQHLNDYVTHFEVSEREIKSLVNVQHLRCRIQAELKAGVNDKDCLTQIHPTAAISGLPRQAAKQFITANEPFKRQWYAGTLGFMSPNASEFCVTLRSAQLQGNTLKLYAGAGIVADSNAESEWQEIERKSLTLARLLK